jgi:glutathione S-transferase
MADKKVIIGYWGVSGAAQASRYLLSIVGANW